MAGSIPGLLWVLLAFAAFAVLLVRAASALLVRLSAFEPQLRSAGVRTPAAPPLHPPRPPR